MSELHPSDRKALLRAGFTEREIATQKRKFYNLTQVSPCYTDELKQFEQLVAHRRVLLSVLVRAKDAIEALDGTSVEHEKLVDDYRAAIAEVTGVPA